MHGVSANLPVWDDGDWIPRAKLAGTVRADVCVVGLGGSGLAALEELAAQGVSALGLDARTVGSGAAGRNGGFLLAGLASFYHDDVAAFGRETAAGLYRLTLDELARQAAAFPEIVRRVGSLRLAADAAELADCERQAVALRADHFPVERYAGPEGQGLLLPTDAVMQPLRRVRLLARQLADAGVRWYENSPVRRLTANAVITDEGTVLCDSIIVAVDGRLEAVFPELAPRVRTARLQMLATAPAPEVDFPRPVYWRDGFEYWQQQPDRSIALGGFRDHALASEWTHDAAPTEFIQQLLEKFLREKLKVRAAVTHRWAASVSYASDGLPVLEEVRPKTWAVGAYSGTGNIVGALCGRAAAQRVCGGRSEWMERLETARHAVGRA